MEITELQELHYLVPISNVESIWRRGILSRKNVVQFPHESLADEEILALRKAKRVNNGLPLDHYVNLYITARNPMLYKRLNEPGGCELLNNICILRISPDVIFQDGVVITNRNAARKGLSGFRSSPGGLKYIDYEVIRSGNWNDANAIEYYRKKGIMCSEVLVPNIVEVEKIIGVYVGCARAVELLEPIIADVNIEINRYMFFH